MTPAPRGQWNEEQVKRAMNPTDDLWSFGFGVLYRMCEEYPRHDDPAVVVGKLWLIGRSHSASVERRRTKAEPVKQGVTFLYRRAAEEIIAARLDDQLQGMLTNHSELSTESLPEMLSIHRRLVDALRVVIDQDKTSLASKYLHFHAKNLFVIYDSIANAKMKKLFPRQRVARYDGPEAVDATYHRFARLALALRTAIEDQHSCRFTPRELDRFLLSAS